MPCPVQQSVSRFPPQKTSVKCGPLRKSKSPVPLFLRKDEIRLILEYRNASDRRTKNIVFNKLYAAYDMLLTHVLIRGWKISNVNLKDTIEYSTALMAFVDALDKFNIDSGFRFSTFLTHHVNLHMTRHRASYDSGVNKYAEEMEGRELEYSESDVEGNYHTGAIESSSSLEKKYCEEKKIFENLDEEDAVEEELLKSMSPQIVFGLKNLTRMFDSRLGRYHIFKLIGTGFRAELTELLNTYNFVIMLVIRVLNKQPEICDDLQDTSF